jgi:hypothetical protein
MGEPMSKRGAAARVADVRLRGACAAEGRPIIGTKPAAVIRQIHMTDGERVIISVPLAASDPDQLD